jgi:hypothetical protein
MHNNNVPEGSSPTTETDESPPDETDLHGCLLYQEDDSCKLGEKILHEIHRDEKDDDNHDEEVSDPDLLFDREWEVDSDGNVHPRSSSHVYDWMMDDKLMAEILANEEEAIHTSVRFTRRTILVSWGRQ